MKMNHNSCFSQVQSYSSSFVLNCHFQQLVFEVFRGQMVRQTTFTIISQLLLVLEVVIDKQSCL